MHPIPARVQAKSPLSAEERAQRLADFITTLGAPVVLNQEVFPDYIEAMGRKGFTVLEASCGPATRCDETALPVPHCRGYTVRDTSCQVGNTTRRQWELIRQNRRPFGQETMTAVKSWKFGFTGLAVLLRPGSGFQVRSHRFLRFANAVQAGLGMSESGVMRTDGLQVVTLYDQRKGSEYIVVNTHLESYNQAYRQGQFRELVKELRKLRRTHAMAVIQVAGDFNWEQANFNLKMRNQLRAVSTTWEQEEWCTHVGTMGSPHRFDGVHTLLPRSLRLVSKKSRTIPSRDAMDPSVDLSDHKFVSVKVELKRR
jgi:hypothetical protein